MLLLPSGNLFAQEPQNTFELAYKSFGVKISVPDGYVAKEVNMIWQGNLKNSKIKNGLFTTAAFSSDGQCAILYSMPAYNYITKGVDDSVNGYMGYIYREVFQVHNLIDEDSKHRRSMPTSFAIILRHCRKGWYMARKERSCHSIRQSTRKPSMCSFSKKADIITTSCFS